MPCRCRAWVQTDEMLVQGTLANLVDGVVTFHSSSFGGPLLVSCPCFVVLVFRFCAAVPLHKFSH